MLGGPSPSLVGTYSQPSGSEEPSNRRKRVKHAPVVPRVLQWNADNMVCNRARGSELEQFMQENSVVVALIQEGGPTIAAAPGASGRVLSALVDVFATGRASVVTLRQKCNSKYRPDLSVESAEFDGCVVDMCIEDRYHIRMISAYRTHDANPEAFVTWVTQRLCGDDMPCWPTVVGCDANIHSSYGMVPNPGPTGRLWDSAIETLHLEVGTVCLNVVGIPTWRDHVTRTNPRRPSAIDYTLFTPGSESSGAISVSNWMPFGCGTSDHERILLDLHLGSMTPSNDAESTQHRRSDSAEASEIPGEAARMKVAVSTNEISEAQINRYQSDLRVGMVSAAVRGHQNSSDYALAVTKAIQNAALSAKLLRRPTCHSARERSDKMYGWDSACTDLLRKRDNLRRDIEWYSSLPLADRPSDFDSVLHYLRTEWRKCDSELVQSSDKARRAAWMAACSTLTVNTPVSDAFRLVRRLGGSTVTSSTSSSTPMHPLQSEDGRIAFTASDQANMLAGYWAHRCSLNHPDNATFLEGHMRRVNSAVQDIDFFQSAVFLKTGALYLEQNAPFTRAEVAAALDSTRNTAPGRDGILRRFLVWGGEELLGALVRLYNMCLDEGCFPSMWKIASIVPIPKTARPSSPSQLRPISLLPILGKVLEHLIKGRLMWIVFVSNAACPEQTAYSAHRSTVHQLLRIIDGAKEAWRKRKQLVLVSFDISRAFDTVWHEGLLYKLKSIGVIGNLLRLVASFLSDRKGRASVGGCESEPVALQLGVPQGSVLGPMLWNIYFNSIGEVIKESCPEAAWGAYADDSDDGAQSCSKTTTACT